MNATQTLSGWGNYPRVDARLLAPADRAGVLAAIATETSLIARGNGRAYGDAALNERATLSMLACRGIDFDAAAGCVTCAAGTMLADVIDAVLPNWFVPVTPGTRFVTIGGMLAADVHGKNHHVAGGFGDHVEAIELALADGRVIRCTPAGEHAEIFAATRGGMGLTGIILTVTFRLIAIETAFIRQQTRRAGNLEQVMALFEATRGSTYSVAWIDCLASGAALGRSLLYLGEHARAGEVPPGLPPRRRPARRVPLDFPAWVLNRFSVRAFNELYFRTARRGQALVHYETYFYPLDALLQWNRIYGRGGFVQYQCVLPKAASAAGLAALLGRIALAGAGSFLSVLKLFGAQRGVLSFPMEGYTLALDFPATARTFALLGELDAIVADHGGRLYLAKDARMGSAMFRRGYERLDEFLALRARLDASGKFASVQSRRLGI
jgi:decaprenylphospho-beta-D-ribofuranose 2-oxidase